MHQIHPMAPLHADLHITLLALGSGMGQSALGTLEATFLPQEKVVLGVTFARANVAPPNVGTWESSSRINKRTNDITASPPAST